MLLGRWFEPAASACGAAFSSSPQHLFPRARSPLRQASPSGGSRRTCSARWRPPPCPTAATPVRRLRPRLRCSLVPCPAASFALARTLERALPHCRVPPPAGPACCPGAAATHPARHASAPPPARPPARQTCARSAAWAARRRTAPLAPTWYMSRRQSRSSRATTGPTPRACSACASGALLAGCGAPQGWGRPPPRAGPGCRWKPGAPPAGACCWGGFLRAPTCCRVVPPPSPQLLQGRRPVLHRPPGPHGHPGPRLPPRGAAHLGCGGLVGACMERVRSVCREPAGV